MDTKRLNKGLVEWRDSEEPNLPEFNSVGELAYFIIQAYNSPDETDFDLLIEDLQELTLI